VTGGSHQFGGIHEKKQLRTDTPPHSDFAGVGCAWPAWCMRKGSRQHQRHGEGGGDGHAYRAGGATTQAKAGADGTFSFAKVAPGTYKVTSDGSPVTSSWPPAQTRAWSLEPR